MTLPLIGKAGTTLLIVSLIQIIWNVILTLWRFAATKPAVQGYFARAWAHFAL